MRKTIMCLSLIMGFLFANSASITSTTSGGNWSSPLTWVGGVVPTSSDDVTIDGNVTINGNYLVKTITINSGKVLTSQMGGRKLTISSLSNPKNGNFYNNGGTFVSNDGVVEFIAFGNNLSVGGVVSFNKVILNNVFQMDFGGRSTINDTLFLDNGAFLDNKNRPSYGPNGVLNINTNYGSDTWKMDNNIPSGSGSNVPPNIYFNVTPTQFNNGTSFYIKKTLKTAPGVTFTANNTCMTFSSTFVGITNGGTMFLGDITVENGCTWNINNNYNINRLKIENGGIVNVNSYVLNFNTQNNTGACFGSSTIIQVASGGQFNTGTSTIILNPTNPMNIVGNITFNNVIVMNQTVTPTDSVNINGSYTNINSGNISGVVLGPTSTQTNLNNILSPNVYTLTSDLTITGTRKVVIVNVGAELVSAGYTLTADSIYVYGKLTLSNTGGLSSFLGTTKILIASGSTIQYNSTSTQTITPTTYSNLTLGSSGTKTLSGTYNVGGDFVVSGGTIDFSSNPIINFNGNSQNIAGQPYKNVTFSGSGNKTLLDTTKVTGVITMGGTATLVSNGLLTLVSNALGTASIIKTGTCSTCTYVTGNVKVQRYIPAVARRWRFLGSPITNGTFADWKGETYITGSGGASNGFDATSTNTGSVFGYNETLITGDLNTGWVGASNITNSLVVGKGYRLFIRGDRSNTGRLTGTVATQNEVTLDLVGPLNQGDITMPVSFTSSGNLSDDGWCLLSNPYAAPYDWNAHYDAGTFNSNISSVVWVLNAQTNSYVSYNATSNAGSLTGGLIPSGASFWVKAISASPTLTFKEQFKVGTTPLNMFKTDEGESFTIKLYLDSINSDEMIVKYMDSSTINYDMYDIRKMVGGINISSYGSDTTQLLSLTVRPTVLTLDTIKLKVTAGVLYGSYKLIFTNSQELALHDNVLLFDTYLSTVTDLKVTSVYSFNISAISATQGSSRFYIVTGSNSLPVKLLLFTATKNKSKVVLNWSTGQEINNSHFELERSGDGITFETIGMIQGNKNTTRVINYSYTDISPLMTNYYRLKQIDLDGKYSLSNVNIVTFKQGDVSKEPKMSIYPNPTVDYIYIDYNNSNLFVSHITIYDMMGYKIFSQDVKINDVNYLHVIDVTKLKSGMYYLRVDKEDRFNFIKR